MKALITRLGNSTRDLCGLASVGDLHEAELQDEANHGEGHSADADDEDDDQVLPDHDLVVRNFAQLGQVRWLDLGQQVRQKPVRRHVLDTGTKIVQFRSSADTILGWFRWVR